jgi:hypothetical protein
LFEEILPANASPQGNASLQQSDTDSENDDFTRSLFKQMRSYPLEPIYQRARLGVEQAVLKAESGLFGSTRTDFKSWTSDLVDLRRTGSVSYLCTQCETFTLDKCYKSTPAECIWTTSLRRVIRHGRKGCRLCFVLLQALCRPENDPLNHPQVFKHLPESFKLEQKTLAAWLAN